jgi:RNA polymerase sigma-70 factor (ECF subfamily)
MGLVPQDIDDPPLPVELPLSAASNQSEPPPTEPGSAELTLERIHRDHFTFIWRSLRGLGVPALVLDDAAQQVLLIVHRRLPQFGGRSKLRTWLFSIAYRVALNHRRALRRRGPTEPIADDLEHKSSGPEARIEAREALVFVERFLDALPPKKRVLFVLAILEQLPAAEVAAALGIPLNTVYSRVRLIRDEFRRALSQHYGGVAP